MSRCCWFFLGLILLPVAFSCRAEPEPPVNGDAQAVVDESLLAFLSRARSAHHLADLAEEREDWNEGIKVLRKLVEGPVAKKPLAPEAREVLADSHARLADYESRLGHFDKALGDVDAGLKLAREVTYFRGHLFEVKGLVEERRAKQLALAGKEAAAAAAKKRAIAAFEKSMSIQAKVIKHALEEETP